MDSGNNSSGSMQSSSGGEEEYDSRAESSLAALFNNQPPQTQSHVFPFTTNLPLIPPQQHHQQMFDSLSNFLDPTPSLPNPNLIWSKPRSEPNQTDSTSMNQAFISNQLPQVSPTLNCVEMNNTRNNNNTGTVRNPKKRSRASRRAPTTVLTTDTTNFRAMVQEFTGIPAPPFTPSSSLPFSRARFDLFSSSSSTSHFDPPYLLRPFPQKLPHLNSNTNHLKQPLITFSTHNNNNPFLTFQSPKYPPQPNSLEIPLSSAQNSSHIENLGLNNASTVWAQSNVTINGSSSGFNADKGPECGGAVAARNQGTIESWINCSSD